ncbi:MAG: dienelactone hydrolase [Mariniblastus sp.]
MCLEFWFEFLKTAIDAIGPGFLVAKELFKLAIGKQIQERLRMQFKVTLLFALLVFGNSNSAAIGLATDSPWDIEQLFQVPKWEKTQAAAKPGMTGLLYDAIPVRGKRVQAFAYYRSPEGTAPEGGWPAVVCVHGGGGTAFDVWVKKWNDHGYAAISMDLEGHFPKGSPSRMENPGLKRLGIFKNYQDPIEQQWYYHAVAQAIQAHSLIRSFPEVNADKIGLTGISWGGTLTSTIMGLDSRFKFAIPVYGCGFLPESDGNQGMAIKPGEYSDFVNKYYDGSAYFSKVTYPTLWVNGTNDTHFPMPSTQKSSQAVAGLAILRFELRMSHGHGAGWRPAEIYAFADSIVKDGLPLPKLTPPKIEGDQVTSSFVSTAKITKSQLLYTRDSGLWPQRKWETAPAKTSAAEINAIVPEGATVLFFNLTDERGLLVSSEFIQIK